MARTLRVRPYARLIRRSATSDRTSPSTQLPSRPIPWPAIAFYGAGCVTRDANLSSRGLSYGSESETVPPDWGPWWVGLPEMRSWLSWYGKPYSDLVAPALGAAGIARGDGLRVRLGPAPMDSDEVRGVGPSLPRDLQAVRSPTQDDAPWR